MKYLARLREFFKKTPIFRTKDVELIVKNKKYTHLVLHNLVKSGEINRVAKGWYSLHEDPAIAVFSVRPAYIGLQEALSIHGIWEQETNVVVVTARRVRTGVRKFLDSNVVLHRIDKKYMFGFEYMKYGDLFIPVSDLEKTLIDLIYFNEIPGKNILEEIKKRVDKEKLREYLLHFPKKTRKKVSDKIKIQIES